MSTRYIELFLNATGATLYMVGVSALLAALIGIPLGVALYITRQNRFCANRKINLPLAIIVNIGRSIPFIILIVYIVPFTRQIVGTSIGNTAAIVPLTISAIPFVARMIEGVLLDVPAGLVEAAQSMGATPLQIIRKVLLAEATPGIINAMTITIIALIGYSAMAGAVGAGGLGKVAIAYGYHRYNLEIMNITIVIIVLLVQGVQSLGDYLARRFDHR